MDALRNLVGRFLPVLAIVATLGGASAEAQERLISYNTDHELPAAVSIQAGIQRGDTSIVVWGTYSYSSDWRIRFHLVAQALHDTVQIGTRTIVTDTSCVPSYFVALAPIADRFLVIWTDKRPERRGLYGRMLTSRAESVGQPFLLIEGSDARREHVRMFLGDGCVLLLHAPKVGDTAGLDLLVIDATGDVKRQWLARTRLDGVRPLGELRGLLVCDADTCRVLDAKGVAAPFELPRALGVAEHVIRSDSSWVVVKDSALFEFASLASPTPSRVRPIRGAASGATLIPALDSAGRLRILQYYTWLTPYIQFGAIIKGTDVDVAVDTIRLSIADTLASTYEVLVPTGSITYGAAITGRHVVHLPNNVVQITSPYTRSSQVRSEPPDYRYGAFRFTILDARHASMTGYDPARPDGWRSEVTNPAVNRVNRAGASVVEVALPDVVRLAEPLMFVGGQSDIQLARVFAASSGPMVFWSEGRDVLRVCRFNRPSDGSTGGFAFRRFYGMTSLWVQSTPVGFLVYQTSPEAWPVPGQRVLHWIDDDVTVVAPTGFYGLYFDGAVEPDSRRLRVWTYDPVGRALTELEQTMSGVWNTLLRTSANRSPAAGMAPLRSPWWVEIDSGRPSRLVTLDGRARSLVADSVAARPGASIVRLRQSDVLRWYAYQDSTGTGTEFERIHVDDVKPSTFVTGRGRLPGVAPTAEISVVEDSRSDTVRALFVQGEDLMIARFEPIDFHVIDATRVAPGAVKPTLPSGVIIGDSLYVVWVDRRDVRGAIWGVSIALDATRKQTLSERQVRTPLGQDTTEWLPPEPVPPGPFPDPPLRPPTYSSYELRIWPTPAHEHVRVTTGTAGASSVRFDLLDMRGRLLKSRLVVTANQGAAHVVLPVDDVANGTYIIRVLRGERVEYGRVIVVHPE